MKTKEIEEEFYVSSGSLSSCIRTFDLGIIAVVWALSNQNSNELFANKTLRMVLFFVVASLAFDVVHYMWRSITMGISLKIAEKKDKQDNKEYDNHEYINGTELGSYVIWGIKTILCVVSAVYLIVFFVNSWSPHSASPQNDFSPKEPPRLTPSTYLKESPSLLRNDIILSSCYIWNGFGTVDI